MAEEIKKENVEETKKVNPVVKFFSKNKMHINREAALIEAYTVADKSLSQYKEAIKEKLGEKKSEEIVESNKE